MPEEVKSLLVRPMACIRDYAFTMNVVEEIFEIRSCIEILATEIKVDTTGLIEHGLTSAPTQYRLYGRRFLQV